MAFNSNTDEMKIRRMAFPVIIVIGAMVAGLFVNPIWAWAAMGAAMFGAILLGHSVRVLFVFWLWASIAPLVLQYTASSVVGYFDEILMLFVIGSIVGGVVLKKRQLSSMGGFMRLFMGLLLVLMISFLFNDKSLINTFQALFTYYLFPSILVATVMYIKCSRRNISLFIKCLLGLFLVQFVLNIGWFLRINPLVNRFRYSTVDFAQGTFASSAWAAYFSIAVIFLCFSAGLKVRGKKRGLWLVGALAALLNLYMAHTNHAYLMVAVLYGLFIFLFTKERAMKLVLAGCALVGAFTLLALERQFSSAEYSGYQENIGQTFSSENLSRRWRSFKLSPKVRLLDRIVVKNARNTPIEWLVGMGPGMGVSVVGMANVSPKALEYLAEYYFTQSGTQERADGSIMSSAYSGIFSIWSEIGLIGFLLYVALYLYPWMRVWRQFRRGVYLDSMQLIFAENFLLVIPLFLMVNVLTDLLFADYYVVGIWIWAGLIWNPIKELSPAEGLNDISDATADSAEL